MMRIMPVPASSIGGTLKAMMGRRRSPCRMAKEAWCRTRRRPCREGLALSSQAAISPIRAVGMAAMTAICRVVQKLFQAVPPDEPNWPWVMPNVAS